ncbi:MAG: adenosylmethionine--8-amino-7-oxononanoate transaminase [Aureispira sp.]|nr:adenosylmethionine--8-amino-7-oxononanoate transaminase [Aureispira sp.]
MQKTLRERDEAVVWHPFTQMKTAGPAIPVVSGNGVELFDEEGNCYLDVIASWWMTLHGHGHPYIAKRIAEQANKLEHVIFASFTHEPAIELAERLLDKLPANQSKIFYSDNGSTSCEVAVKMCFQYWHNKGDKRKKMIALDDAYHGDTFGAMSVGGRGPFVEPFMPFLFDVAFIDAPVAGEEEKVLKQLEGILKGGDVAGFIFEPLVQGSAGMRMYSPEVLEKMLSMCKEYGVLTVADEVMTGFGHLGKFFAVDYVDTKPDIICMSKGLTGGTMAMGATSCTQDIFDAFWDDEFLNAFLHGHSATGNPLACAAALASMDLMDNPETQKNIDRIASRNAEFAKKLEQYPIYANVRHIGVILAMEVVTDEENNYFNSLRDTIWQFLIKKGLLMRPLGNTVYILPPYCITDEQLDKAYDAIIELAGFLTKN